MSSIQVYPMQYPLSRTNLCSIKVYSMQYPDLLFALSRPTVYSIQAYCMSVLQLPTWTFYMTSFCWLNFREEGKTCLSNMFANRLLDSSDRLPFFFTEFVNISGLLRLLAYYTGSLCCHLFRHHTAYIYIYIRLASIWSGNIICGMADVSYLWHFHPPKYKMTFPLTPFHRQKLWFWGHFIPWCYLLGKCHCCGTDYKSLPCHMSNCIMTAARTRSMWPHFDCAWLCCSGTLEVWYFMVEVP